MRVKGVGLVIALVVGSSAEPIQRAVKAPKIDLGYAVYEGTHDANTSINIFKGYVVSHRVLETPRTNCFYRIRYAAPPLGKLRFAAPQAPTPNRTTTLALSDPPFCPQTGASSETPSEYGFTSAIGDEDCLFLNVYAPANAKKLPVFLWIRK